MKLLVLITNNERLLCILKKLQDLLMKARIEKDTQRIELYGYLIGQSTLKNKAPTDNEIFSVVKSYIKSIKNIPPTENQDFTNKCNFEIDELNNFLPK